MARFIWLSSILIALLMATGASGQSSLPVSPKNPEQVRDSDLIEKLPPTGEQNLSPLAQLKEMSEIDRPGSILYRFDLTGSVSSGGTLYFEFLSDGKAGFSKVTLLISTATSNPKGSSLCNSLVTSSSKVTTLVGTVKSEIASDKVIAAATTAGMKVSGSGPLYLNRVSALPNSDLQAAVAEGPRKLLVRAFPIGANGACLSRSTPAFTGDFSKSIYGNIVIEPPAPSPKQPYVVATSKVVGWSPAIDSPLRCSFIITKAINDPAYKAVLDYKKISTSVGTRFTLCPDEAKYVYEQLPLSKRALITLQNLLSWFAGGYNWTSDKFQSIAKTAGKPLAPILGDKGSQMYASAMLGQLPGDPLTGDFNTVVDRGCEYAKAKLNDAAEAKGIPANDSNKKETESLVQKSCDVLKGVAQQSDRPNDYLIHDTSKDARGPIMFVRVTYLGVNNPPKTMMGGNKSMRLTVRSIGGPGPYVMGNGGASPLLLFERDIDIPRGTPGTSMILPIIVQKVNTSNSVDYSAAYTAYAGARANAGGYSGDDLMIYPGSELSPPKK
jgi:hypothetical protein